MNDFSPPQSKGRRGQQGEGKCIGSVSCIISTATRSQSHIQSLSRTRLTANSQRRLKKGQKQRGQLVFSQLICQSGPQTSDHITVNPPDKSRRGGGGSSQDSSPVTLTSPWAKNSDGPGHFAQDPGSPSDGGRVACHSSRPDVTWPLRC